MPMTSFPNAVLALFHSDVNFLGLMQPHVTTPAIFQGKAPGTPCTHKSSSAAFIGALRLDSTELLSWAELGKAMRQEEAGA